MNGGIRRPAAAAASLGYTIIEVMIVLAVSGVMFMIAAQFISGKEGGTSFTGGVNEFATTLQDTIQGVTDGQYTDIKVNCSFDGASTSFPAGANGQGTNPSCVFLGKVMHLSEDVSGATASRQYEVFSLAGGRIGSDGKPITGLAAAKPAVIPRLTSQENIPQSLDVTRVKVNDGSVADSYGIGFIQGLGTPEVTGDVQNGTQTVGLYYVSGMGPGISNISAPGLVNAGSLVMADKIDICISDGTRYATITLGENNNQLAVNVAMHGESNIC